MITVSAMVSIASTATSKAAAFLRLLPSRALATPLVPLRHFAMRLVNGNCWAAQREVHTDVDRYPRIFEAAAEFARRHLLHPGRRLRILSFGCSTGEECFSLLNYFPDAEIHGCDINERVLSVANSRFRQGPIRFFFSDSEALKEHGPYDIIFCMSSLCMFPDSNRVSKASGAFTLASFDQLLSSIDGALRPGGLLVAYNTNYPVRMASIAARYQALDCDIVVENGFVNKLRQDGRVFTITEAVNHTRAHRIVNDDPSFTDADFSSALFWKIDERGSLPDLILSPAADGEARTIGRYCISDEDIFLNKDRLLATSIDVTLVQERSGLLYEQVLFTRRSVKDAEWLQPRPYRRLVRLADALQLQSMADEPRVMVPAVLL